MKSFLPNPWPLACGISILSYFTILGLKLLFTTSIAKLLKMNRERWNDYVVSTIAKTGQLFIIGLSLYIGFKFIRHTKRVNLYADRAFFVILMWQIAIWLHYVMLSWISATIRKKSRKNPAVANSISLIQLFSRAILFSIIFLFTLSNLGIKITTIIAGLGVGGIAVALALQKILGDLFASLSIVLDKPFVVGDFIIIDSYLGEVEKIGLKTTRIRSLGGEQIIFSNSDILGARIRNYKRMVERRIPLNFHMPLNTSTEKLRTALSVITAIISIKKQVRFERCHLAKIGHTLEIEAIYWILNDDYNIHMDVQQDILFEIKSVFESEGIQFAYPTQTLNIMPTELLMRNLPAGNQVGQRPLDSIIS